MVKSIMLVDPWSAIDPSRDPICPCFYVDIFNFATLRFQTYVTIDIKWPIIIVVNLNSLYYAHN